LAKDLELGSMTIQSKAGGRLSVSVALVLGTALGACARDSGPSDPVVSNDVRERHPIVLRDAPRSLDIFVGRAGGGLDPRQAEDVAKFGEEYRNTGRGGLVAEIPTGTGRGRAARDTLEAIRRSLAHGGDFRLSLTVKTYPIGDPNLATPIRLTFASLRAELPHTCGRWTDDAGISDWRQNTSNVSLWNFGCSSQATLAAQIADPIDLVRARSEGRADTVKRMNAIGKLRQATDPSTLYRQQPSQINSSVGQ
jgi:pilus assembly protein CpaD